MGRTGERIARVYNELAISLAVDLGLGAIDEAFAWMDRAADGHDCMLVPIQAYAFLDPLRDDPRYTALLAKMRMRPPAGQAGGIVT